MKSEVSGIRNLTFFAFVGGITFAAFCSVHNTFKKDTDQPNIFRRREDLEEDGDESKSHCTWRMLDELDIL